MSFATSVSGKWIVPVTILTLLGACSGADLPTARVPVAPPAPEVPVAGVLVSADSTRMAVGSRTQVTGLAVDSRGSPIAGKSLTWSSASGSVLSVSSSGLATAIAPGTGRVVGTVDGVTGEAIVSIAGRAATSASVARVVVVLGALTIRVGDSVVGSASAFDAADRRVSGRAVTWEVSRNPHVASVSASGVVTAIAPGDATIAATIDGIRGEVTLSVLDATATTVILPAEPTLLNFSYPRVTGRTHVVRSGGSLQDALNAAQRGDEIVLDAGATFQGNFVLPVKSGTAANGWIIVRSSASASLPAAGSRVGPAHQSLMPKVVTGGTGAALSTAPGTSGWWIEGVEFSIAPSVTKMVTHIVGLGTSGANQRTLAQVPSDLVLDRVYIHPLPTQQVQRCLALNSARTQVADSYLYDCHAKGYDSQAILGFNGPGPFRIVNNMLAGAGENVMFGGADPSIPNLVPADVEFRRNYVYTPPAWKGVWTKKNLFETKNVERVLIEGNVFDGSWADGQTGFAFVLKVSNQSGNCRWCATRDVIVRDNLVRNVAGGFAIMGITSLPANPIAERLTRVLIENNVLEQVNTGMFTGEARLVSMMNDAQNVTIRRNSFLATGDLAMFLNLATNPAATNFAFEENVVPHGRWGFYSSWFGTGENSLQGFRGNVTFGRNVIVGAPQAGYPSSRFAPSVSAALQMGAGADRGRVDAATRGVDVP